MTRAYLEAHPEIMVEELPAYAPELNPEEYCHGNVKQYLKNARPSTKPEIRSNLDRGFNRLRRLDPISPAQFLPPVWLSAAVNLNVLPLSGPNGCLGSLLPIR